MVNHIVEIGHDNRHRRAKCAQLFVHAVQTAIGVAALEHGLHALGHIIQPKLHRVIVVQAGIRRRKPEPWPRRASGTSHHARAQSAQRPGSRVVVDAVVSPPALVAILPEVPAIARQQEVRDLLPMRPPGGSLRLELAPSREQLIAARRSRIRTRVTNMLAHDDLLP